MLSPLVNPSVHLMVTNNHKGTMHSPNKIKVGDQVKKDQHVLVITKIKDEAKSTYYDKAIFYEFEYKILK